MDVVEVLRLVFGTVFVLFLPGLAWSYVFFNKDEIDWIERVALSFGLSIALVPLTVFWLNYLFKVKITLTNVTITILLLILIPVLIIKFNLKQRARGIKWLK